VFQLIQCDLSVLNVVVRASFVNCNPIAERFSMQHMSPSGHSRSRSRQHHRPLTGTLDLHESTAIHTTPTTTISPIRPRCMVALQ
jgi:hypothetical protein